MTLDFSKLGGLLPAVIQDHDTGRVLMVGFMNEASFRLSIETGFATFYSRSRRTLWTKGETSGHRLVIRDIATDCDADTLLIRVQAQGPGVCHKGYASCFFRRWSEGAWRESEPRAYEPGSVYRDR